MANYYVILFTDWTIAAPIEQVWQVIYNFEEWPRWWKYFISVTKLPDGEGAKRTSRFTCTTPLSRRITFDIKLITVKAPHILDLEVTGDVKGEGSWQLKTVEGGTSVYYTWTVEVTKPQTGVLSIFTQPLMYWNYDVIMQEGGKALAKRLGTKLISTGKRKK